MKLVKIVYHFEFGDAVEAILDGRGVGFYVRSAMVEGRDRDGKHYGSKVFPGSSSVVDAMVPESEVDGLLEDLGAFKAAKPSHRHLTAVVLSVERILE